VSYYGLTNESKNPGVNVGSDYIKHFKNNKEREFSLRFGQFGKNDAELNSFQDNPVQTVTCLILLCCQQSIYAAGG
jgi:hypothetical protein